MSDNLFYSTRSVETGLYRLDGEVRGTGEQVDFSPLYEATKESELCYFTPILVMFCSPANVNVHR